MARTLICKPSDHNLMHCTEVIVADLWGYAIDPSDLPKIANFDGPSIVMVSLADGVDPGAGTFTMACPS